MIEVKHLTKWYGRVAAVNDISFHVDRGRIVGFLGPNGAGKSTTLKILTCYQPATSGSASIDGLDVLSQSMEVRKRVGYMPEAVPLYPEMRVRELLMFFAALRDIPRRRRSAAVDQAAERCWLSKPQDMMRRKVGELSRGYKQRVGLAEVLLHNPPVLVLDEPTIGLDPAQIRAMRDLIRELGQDHTIIFSSHILAEVEQVSQQLILIAGGRIVAGGTPAELRQRVVGPSRIIAEIRSAGDEADKSMIADLAAIDGVKEVVPDTDGQKEAGWLRLAIQGTSAADLRGDVFNLASSKGWQLRELRRQVGSLEDFFIQMTYQQSIKPAAIAAQA